MRVSFIGCPCSGKTTTAFMTVAKLKEAGISCEFIGEQARLYIAEKRYAKMLTPSEGLALTDEDQLNIMQNQLRMERIMATVTGADSIIISDSSPINSLLYMSDEAREKAISMGFIKQALESADLIFYTPPVTRFLTLDPNRIHTEEQSLAIDKTIPGVLTTFAPTIGPKMVNLHGNAEDRLGQVFSAIINKNFE